MSLGRHSKEALALVAPLKPDVVGGDLKRALSFELGGVGFRTIELDPSPDTPPTTLFDPSEYSADPNVRAIGSRDPRVRWKHFLEIPDVLGLVVATKLPSVLPNENSPLEIHMRGDRPAVDLLDLLGPIEIARSLGEIVFLDQPLEELIEQAGDAGAEVEVPASLTDDDGIVPFNSEDILQGVAEIRQYVTEMRG